MALDTSMTLPTLIFGSVEAHRLQRELEALEEYAQQATIRNKADKQPLTLPQVSRLLNALATENHKDLLKADDRAALAVFLQQVITYAPTLHISFATDPSAAFTAKIVGWLRSNIHPLVLVQLGLQPSIAAGCVVRTTNKVFDLSLRDRFSQQKSVLLTVLEGGTKQ